MPCIGWIVLNSAVIPRSARCRSTCGGPIAECGDIGSFPPASKIGPVTLTVFSAEFPLPPCEITLPHTYRAAKSRDGGTISQYARVHKARLLSLRFVNFAGFLMVLPCRSIRMMTNFRLTKAGRSAQTHPDSQLQKNTG